MIELIQTFNFGINEVRTAIKDNGDVYFCLKDIATVLGIQDTQTKNFNLDEKGVEKIPTPTNGGMQHLNYINEPNLYRVIFRSNKAEARQFQDLVFNEVLPTIRKTGSFNTKPAELTAKEKVAWMQAWLNANCGTKLEVDGVWGTLSRSTFISPTNALDVREFV